MDKDQKKAAIAWKERQAKPGIYAVRCGAAQEIWIGQTGDLAKIENRIQFTLSHGGGSNPGLQAAWLRHGGEAFGVEVVEAIDGDQPAFAVRAQLKQRLAHWQKALGARLL